MSGNAIMAFDDLDVEALAIVANDAAAEVESSARKTVEHAERCGRALLAAKEKIAHGQWLGWLSANFDYNQQHASRYMTIASNYSRVSNLKEATSLREALRMIAEDPETPKRERKPSVEVIEPIEVESKPIVNDPRLPQPKPERTTGETATNAVSREETRKAPAHRQPEKFTPVTPSYDEEDDGYDDIGEPARDLIDMFVDMKQLIREAMHEVPESQRANMWVQIVEQLSKEDVSKW